VIVGRALNQPDQSRLDPGLRKELGRLAGVARPEQGGDFLDRGFSSQLDGVAATIIEPPSFNQSYSGIQYWNTPDQRLPTELLRITAKLLELSQALDLLLEISADAWLPRRTFRMKHASAGIRIEGGYLDGQRGGCLRR
jgi:hypothetical protein